jgi:hypothetical protein
MKFPVLTSAVGAVSALVLSPLTAIAAYADEDGTGPHIHEESHGLEGLPIAIIIAAIIIAVGLAYGIGRRSRK